ncbi:hypothetical protein JOD69_004643 [Methylocaldum sp. RMAD-M]|nr:hypothetical protein [Methylocaldum sp. RMAD-M]
MLVQDGASVEKCARPRVPLAISLAPLPRYALASCPALYFSNTSRVERHINPNPTGYRLAIQSWMQR